MEKGFVWYTSKRDNIRSCYRGEDDSKKNILIKIFISIIRILY